MRSRNGCTTQVKKGKNKNHDATSQKENKSQNQ